MAAGFLADNKFTSKTFNMLKKAQVHMLSTDIGNITETSTGGLLFSKYPYKPSNITGQPQHLYFTTDEEIKEGDWVLDMNFMLKDRKPYKVLASSDLSYLNHPKKLIFKIVATTNPELWWDMDRYSLDEEDRQVQGVIMIPKIGLDFVEAQVKKQGDIKEVNLEYKAIDGGFWDMPTVYTLNLRSNGTVIIHPIKEKMYSRTEMLAACSRAFLHMIGNLPYDTVSFEEWKREWFDLKYPEHEEV
jgi:hypothetical protein